MHLRNFAFVALAGSLLLAPPAAAAQGACCAKMPVVAFNCIHLERDHAKAHRVVLGSKGDGTQQFFEFQFAGETAAHGLPTER